MGYANNVFKTLIRRRDFLNDRIGKCMGPESSFLLSERDALNWLMDDYVKHLKNKGFYEYGPKKLKEDFEKRNQDDTRSEECPKQA